MENESLKPRPSRGLWKIIFAISLTVNITVLGILGGAAMKFNKDPHAGKTQLRERHIGSIYIRALSRDQKRELGRRMRELERNHKQNGGKTEAGFQEAVHILRKADFDQEKFETVIRGYAERSNQRLKIAQMTLLSHINSMNITEQSAYVDHIELVLTRDS